MTSRDDLADATRPTIPTTGERLLTAVLRVAAVPLILLAALLMAVIYSVCFLGRQVMLATAFLLSQPRPPHRVYNRR